MSDTPQVPATAFTATPPLARVSSAADAPPRVRLWPALLILIVQWSIALGAAYLAPGTAIHFFGSFMGPLVGGVLFLLWWTFASGVPWRDRISVLACVVAVGAAVMFGDSIPQIGGFKLFLYALPVAAIAWCLWLLLTPMLRWPVRRAGLQLIVVLALGVFTLLRIDGVKGDMAAEMRWAWVPTTEQKFLAERAAAKATVVPTLQKSEALALQPGDWPAFRGPQRDGRVPGVKLATDWNKNPPKLLWRHKVGPGWSSFAVVGDHVFTQEQWDQQEAVVCYRADTGSELWHHLDDARFTEPIGGNGPRATPTFHDGKLYTLGAKGKLDCLDAVSGKLLWSRDVAVDTGAKVPQWGFASSPLVLEGLVSVFAGGPAGKSIQAYDATTGTPAWYGGKGTHSYSSPQPARIAGVEQVLIVSEQSLGAFDPKTGAGLWSNDWATDMQRVIQPALLAGDDVLFGSPMGAGTRRLHISHSGDKWEVKEVWSTNAISPYFNDLVIHKDHLYGFENSFLTCVALKDGKRRWKERGYGTGQVLLLPDQDLLLVLAEDGAVALVAAQPDRLSELARIQALEGKTWNHPVLAHGRLYARNAEEMACFELRLLPGDGVSGGSHKSSD